MTRIGKLFVYVSLLTLVGCASLPHATNRIASSGHAILLVTAENMNASINSKELSSLMKSEVATFCRALKSKLEKESRHVALKKYERASQSDIAYAIAGMEDKPGVLVQVYWTSQQDNSLYIVADALQVRYSESTRAARFELLGEKRYLSIGLKAKPTDTPEAHAAEFSRYLKSILP